MDYTGKIYCHQVIHFIRFKTYQSNFSQRRFKMTTGAIDQRTNISSINLATKGAIAGLAGGVVFGMMMGMMGMLPMIGMLVGVQNAIVGFIVHMLISAFIGAVYGIVAGRFTLNTTNALIGGMINSVVWWMLGALILMPVGLGMANMVFVIGQTQWLSLMGHVIYGLITAFVFIPLAKRA
jgi:hypothetical protein